MRPVAEKITIARLDDGKYEKAQTLLEGDAVRFAGDSGKMPTRPRATKTIDENGQKLAGYSTPYRMRFEECDVIGLQGLFTYLSNTADDPSALLLMGRLTDFAKARPDDLLRRLSIAQTDQPASLIDAPGHLFSMDLGLEAIL